MDLRKISAQFRVVEISSIHPWPSCLAVKDIAEAVSLMAQW